MSHKTLFEKPDLVPIKRVTKSVAKSLIIGESFVDLARLGLMGEYTEVPATDECPRLFYRWNYQHGKWEIYAIDNDLIGYNLTWVSGVEEKIAKINAKDAEQDSRLDALENPTEEPTEEPTESPTEEPTEEPSTEEPTEEPTEAPTVPPFMSSIRQDNEKTGGNLQETHIDEYHMNLKGLIKWYSAEGLKPVAGNYVGVTITAAPELWDQYKEQLVLIHRGMRYGYEVFDTNGSVTLMLYVSNPDQIMPISLEWVGIKMETFEVIIDPDSVLETDPED